MKNIWSYWKEVIVISIFCICFFIIADFLPYQGDDTASPFWMDTNTLTGPEYMAIHWPSPKPNDPNFLRDYEIYMGHKWLFEDDY